MIIIKTDQLLDIADRIDQQIIQKLAWDAIPKDIIKVHFSEFCVIAEQTLRKAKIHGVITQRGRFIFLCLYNIMGDGFFHHSVFIDILKNTNDIDVALHFYLKSLNNINRQ